MPQRTPSRRQQQEARKLLRERREAQKARRRLRQNWLIVGGSVLFGGVILGLVGLSIHNRGTSKASLKDASVSPDPLTTGVSSVSTATVDSTKTSPITGVTLYTPDAAKEVDINVTYSPEPPVGGSYNAVWLNCGIYNAPVPNEYAVHSLERGAVWITYQPGLDEKSVEALSTLTTKAGGSVTLSPYGALADKIVASAWGAQLKVTDAKDPRLAQFIKTYQHGSAAPEPNASCTGGIGQPRGTVLAVPSPKPSPTPTDLPSDLTTDVPTAVSAPGPTTTP